MKTLLSVLVLAFLLIVPASAGAIYNAAADFSLAGNPNGVWSYGYETTLGTFTAYTLSTNAFGGNGLLSAWYINNSLLAPDLPAVIKNTSGSTLTWGTVVQPADMLDLHPGQFGELSVVRFTAPADASYIFSGLLQGLDTGNTTTHVFAQINGFSGATFPINLFGAFVPIDGTLALSAGDRVDFLVDFGADGNFFNDSTGLQLTVESVPEPGTWTLLVAGIGLLGAFARRRK
jgi:hypothetical protein